MRALLSESPWYWYLLCAAIALSFAVLLYYRDLKKGELSRLTCRLLILTRFVSVFLICLLLLKIFVRSLVNETEDPLIIIALDNSESMRSARDSAFVKNQLARELAEAASELESSHKVIPVLFGDRIVRGNTPAFTDKETDISALFSHVQNNYAGQNIGALVLVSDGIYNRGINPTALAEGFNFPIYSVASGDTSLLRDIILQRVNHNQVAYAGNNFPVEVIVAAKRYKGAEVQVEILENGQSLGKQQLSISSANQLNPVSFTLSASRPGLQTYSARVTVLNDESNRHNNQQDFVVEVIDNKDRILMVCGAPHPDISAVREIINGQQTYQLDVVSYQTDPQSAKAYNLAIFHNFSSEHQRWLDAVTGAMIPFWIINPQGAESLPGIRVSGQQNRFNDAEPALVNTFGLFGLSDPLKKFLSAAPALKTVFGNYSLSRGTEVLLQQRIGSVETDQPIMVFGTGEPKNAAFLGDGLWRWKLRDYAENQNHLMFTELISKTVQYLAVKSDKSFFRVNAPRIVNENEEILFDAEIYNKSYEPITEPEVTLQLKNEQNKIFSYTFGKRSANYQLNLGSLPAGTYRYIAETKAGAETYRKDGLFTVRAMVAEKINITADHKLLYQLATSTGGKLFYPQNIKELVKELRSSELIRPVTYSQASTLPLISLEWIFWIIVATLALEWSLRKRHFRI